MAKKKGSSKSKSAAKSAAKKGTNKINMGTNKPTNKINDAPPTIPTADAKGLVNKETATNEINKSIFSKAQKKRIDAAMRGREVRHLTLPINNNFPEEHTERVSERLGEVAGHKVWHEDIVLALEAYNAEEDKLIEAAKGDLAASSSN